MTITEVQKELQSLADEELAELRSLDYGEDVDGNPVYEPWQYRFEKDVCFRILTRLNDLLDILGDPVLSEAEKKERFLAKSDDVLKRMKAAGEKEDYEEGYRHVITRLIELQCCLRISI